MRERWMVVVAAANGVGAAVYFGWIGRPSLMALWALFAILAFVTAAGIRAGRAGLITLAVVGLLGHLAAGALLALTLLMTAMGGSPESFSKGLTSLAWCVWAAVVFVGAMIGSLGQGFAPRRSVTRP